MRFPKSEKAQMYFSFVLVVVGLLLFYGLPPVLAQAFADHSVQVRTEQTYILGPATATVNLPYGEKFLAIGPEIGRTGQRTYITEKRPTGELPRLLTFYGPGNTPHSWEPRLYIQEH